MSHRDDCPSESEARREGERAFERGLGRWRNPYESQFPDEGCKEAARAWNSGHHYAEQREEERQQEELDRQRADQRAREEAELEEYYQREEGR